MSGSPFFGVLVVFFDFTLIKAKDQMAGDVIDPRGGPAGIVSLNCHVVQLPSKYLCLYRYISAVLSLVKRSFLLHRVVVNAVLLQVPRTDYQVLSHRWVINLPHPRLREHHGRGGRRNIRAE